jgi:CHAD domain-containing protein
MAKARDVPLHGHDTLAEAAARVVAVRAQEVFEHAAGVLDTTDIERVHAMRVATRRLRAALEVFREAFPKGDLKPVLRDVKRLADALGERRDPDVQLDHFARVRGELPAADRPGIDLLLDRLREDQARGNEHLALALAEMRSCDLEGRLAALAGATVA